MAGSGGVPVYNFTKTLKRGSVVRTLGSDFVLPFAIAFEGLAYGFVGFLAWSLPILFFVGVKFSLWYMALVIVPPILLGYVGTLRLGIFGDRSIASFLSAMITFFFVEPAGWLSRRWHRRSCGYLVSVTSLTCRLHATRLSSSTCRLVRLVGARLTRCWGAKYDRDCTPRVACELHRG